MEGVSQLMSTIGLVKQHLNPNLDIEGVVITMYDGRALVSRQIAAEIKKFFKKKLYEMIIPPQRPPCRGAQPRYAHYALRAEMYRCKSVQGVDGGIPRKGQLEQKEKKLRR